MMEVFWILLGLLVVLLVWLIWAPLTLCINTYQDQYYFSLGGVIVVSPCQRKGSLAVRIKVPLHAFYVDVFQAGNKIEQPLKKKRSGGLSKIVNVRTISAIARTFSVKHFHVDLDTDNYALNAHLFPIFLGLSRGNLDLRTNFLGKAHLWVELENRAIRILTVVIKHTLRKYL